MKRKEQFNADTEGIGKAVEFIGTFLNDYKIEGKESVRAQLTAEEAVASLVEHASEGSSITVSAKAMFGDVMIEIFSVGDDYDFAGSMKETSTAWENEAGEDIQETLRGILLKAYTNGLKYQHKSGKSSIRMNVVRSRNSFLYQTLGSMIIAIILGLLLSQFGNSVFNEDLNKILLVPVKTVYMNALKMVVAPVVFFSIISCIVQFSNLSELGRIGGKVMSFYVFTTVIATLVGMASFFLFRPGSPADAALAVDASSITSQTMDVSLVDVIVGVVPSNFIKPFLDSNMLQLIFMAIVCGIAVGMIGKYSEMLCRMLEALNELFLKMTTLIIKFMPVAVFCSIASMMLTMGVKTLLSILGMFGTFLFAIACMMIVYCLLLLIVGRLNPITFLRKYQPTMLQIFSLASSNASIPLNIDVCEKKLGIDRKIYSLSIPLGATVNMDGGCIYLAVFSLALAKVYGVEITGSALLSLFISIIVLTMGAPGIPGSGLICLSVMVVQIGVPVEAIGLVMGIDSLIGMFRAMNNCLGDVVATNVVAKLEGLMDIRKYKEI